MKRTLAAILVSISTSLFAYEDVDLTHYISDLPTGKLDSPIFFKAIGRGLDTQGKFSRDERAVYYGLATLIVSEVVNGAPQIVPTGFEPAFSFYSNKKLTYVLAKEVRRFEGLSPGFGLGNGELTKIDGQVIPVDKGTLDLPSVICPIETTLSQPSVCKRNYDMGGDLINARELTLIKNVSLALHTGFQSIEITVDSSATEQFLKSASVIASTKAANAAVAANQKKAEVEWRKTIKEGTQTQCGMVVEVRKEIANIQTNSGVKWVRIENLYRPGNSSPCN
jgi:hypothetical protein